MSRSHLMARSKEDLKQEFLFDFKKREKFETVKTFKSQEISMSHYLTPNHDNQENLSYLGNNNKSILDEFSKCPISEEEINGHGESFLSNFMIKRERTGLIGESFLRRTEIMKENDDHINPSSSEVNSMKVSEYSKTPPKVTKFDEKVERSLINVTANLSKLEFQTSEIKTVENKILTDSLIENEDKEEILSHLDSTEEIFTQIHTNNNTIHVNHQSVKNSQESVPVKSLVLDEKESNRVCEQKKETVVKKIMLKTKKSEKLLNEEGSENAHRNNEDDSEDSEKIEKLLKKKSSLKSLIMKKNSEENRKEQKTDQVHHEKIGKWEKLKKNIGEKSDFNAYGNEIEEDPIEWLPPYDSSSSALEAVIEEDNESELEESVKYKKNDKCEFKEMSNENPEKKKSFKTNEKKILHTEVESETANKLMKKLPFEKSWIMENFNLEDLEDVSEIENASGNRFSSSLKKTSLKDVIAELPDYNDSENEENHEEKLGLQRYIVNDISNDLYTLKERIMGDSCDEIGNILGDRKEGDYSALNEAHNRIDFISISRSIMELRNRMERDCSES